MYRYSHKVRCPVHQLDVVNEVDKSQRLLTSASSGAPLPLLDPALVTQSFMLSATKKRQLIAIFEQQQNGYKLKKGNLIPSSLSWFNFGTRLTHSLIKINGNLYVLHNKIGAGGFGKIKIVESLSDGMFYICKISTDSRTLNEVTYLFDNGLFRGCVIRLRQDLATQQLGVKMYILMPYLGKNLQDFIRQRYGTSISNSFDGLRLAGEIATAIAQSHNEVGGGNISGIAYAHRDIKPTNIMLDEHGNIRLIDYGFSNPYLCTKVLPLEGTKGYINISSNSEILTEQDKRTQCFWDVSALRCVFHRLDYYGIFSLKMIKILQLEPYLEKDYVDDKYVTEDTLKVKSALIFAAILFAKLAGYLNSDINNAFITSIFSKRNARIIVGLYYNNKQEKIWHWMSAANEIQVFLQQSEVELKIYERFVYYGLLCNWSKAIHDQFFCSVLNEGDLSHNKDAKRAAVVLFLRDLFSERNYNFVLKNPESIRNCLEAHFYNDKDFFESEMWRSPEDISPAIKPNMSGDFKKIGNDWRDYKNNYESIMNSSLISKNQDNMSANATEYEWCNFIKKVFSKYYMSFDEQEQLLEKSKVLIQSGALSWYCSGLMERRTPKPSLVMELDCMRYLYAFFNHVKYQSVVLAIYDYFSTKQAISVKMSYAALSEFLGRNYIVNAEYFLELIESNLSSPAALRYLTNEFNGSFFQKIHASGLTSKTVSHIFNELTSPFIFIAYFKGTKMSFEAVEKLLIIYSENRIKFNRLIDRMDLRVLNFIYSHPVLVDYIIDSEDELYKCDALKYCLSRKLESNVISLLSGGVSCDLDFLQSIVVMRLIDDIWENKKLSCERSGSTKNNFQDAVSVFNLWTLELLAKYPFIYNWLSQYRSKALNYLKEVKKSTLNFRSSGSSFLQIGRWGVSTKNTELDSWVYEIRDIFTAWNVCLSLEIPLTNMTINYPDLRYFIIQIDRIDKLLLDFRKNICLSIHLFFQKRHEIEDLVTLKGQEFYYIEDKLRHLFCESGALKNNVDFVQYIQQAISGLNDLSKNEVFWSSLNRLNAIVKAPDDDKKSKKSKKSKNSQMFFSNFEFFYGNKVGIKNSRLNFQYYTSQLLQDLQNLYRELCPDSELCPVEYWRKPINTEITPPSPYG